jgi:RNA polymerase sigma-70 factor (ECF subfamily)
VSTQLPDAVTQALESLHVLIQGLYAQGFPFEDAEDCAQDAVVRLLKHPDQIEGIELPSAWLSRVARRRALDLRKKRRPRFGYTPGHNDPIDPGTAPLDGLCNREALDALLCAIEKLPDLYQHVFGLWVQGSTCKEIASALEQNVGTVRSQVHRALKRLRVILVKHE